MLKGIEIRGFQFISFVTNEPEEFERNETELTELLATGRAAPHIGTTFPLADVRAALQLLPHGGPLAKFVFDVHPSFSPALFLAHSFSPLFLSPLLFSLSSPLPPLPPP